MAKNKVVFGNQTLIDLTDTTAEAADVAAGEVFYDRGGNRTVGTGNYMNKVANPTADDILITDANGQAVDSGVQLSAKQDTLVSGMNIKTINGQSIVGPGVIFTMYVIDTDYDSPTSYEDAVNAVNSGATIIAADIALDNANPLTLINNSYIENDTTLYLMGIHWSPTRQKCSIHQWKRSRSTNWVRTDIGDITVGDLPTQATDTTLGTVKLNPDQSVTLNANGQLEVGGRLGQFPTTTGIYAPNNREPRMIADYSFLVTDALGMNMTGNRSLGVVSGYGMACKSAAAGTTEYRVTNNYQNRIICKMAEGGYASRDEATSKAEQIVQIVSVTINGSSFTPDSSTNSSTDIVIKTAQTLNPDSAITNIRLFGTMGAYATINTGNGIKSESGGRNLLLGGGVTKAGSANDNCLVGNGIYSSGNGVAAFGRYHIARKNRGFLAGTGHDTTNAPSEGASAVGQYSYMDANTLFAVGNGSSQTARSNAFEVTSDGGIVLKSPNGTRWKLTVDNSGNLTTTAL